MPPSVNNASFALSSHAALLLSLSLPFR
jgi:hypothetical protein